MTLPPELLTYENNIYRTPDKKIHVFAKLCPSLMFYIDLLKIVFKSSSLAKRNKYDDAEWSRQSLNTIRALEKVGVKVNITGVENIKKLNSACVFVGNHMSVLETFALASMITPYRKFTFVIKESLITYPVFKHVMISRDPIVVGRENPRQDLVTVLQQGAEKLSQDTSIFIFPQRTRTKNFNPEEFNTIGVKLAKRAGVPVLPVAIKSDAWGHGALIKDFGRIDPKKTVHFAFGEPMNISGNGQVEHRDSIEFINTNIVNWTNRDKNTGK
ncbi:1-acyl-sn-glycerol-3-phosphate acyltransferase [candidate division KSB1 bacterium]|nr:1-acyl-sn-glycerol-3-phosphate acyltransferase [candidate division KSB1 bacterium]